jgi:hypothetical protein
MFDHILVIAWRKVVGVVVSSEEPILPRDVPSHIASRSTCESFRRRRRTALRTASLYAHQSMLCSWRTCTTISSHALRRPLSSPESNAGSRCNSRITPRVMREASAAASRCNNALVWVESRD